MHDARMQIDDVIHGREDYYYNQHHIELTPTKSTEREQRVHWTKLLYGKVPLSLVMLNYDELLIFSICFAWRWSTNIHK